MRYIKANGLRIAAELAGAGPELLFIGGTGWDLRARTDPLEPPLTDHFSVMLYDQRGMGRSDKPPGPYRMLDFAEDAISVMDALGWESAHIVGYSFGGMVAQEVAIRWPDRVRRLALAATTPGGWGGSSYPIHRLLRCAPIERARRGLEIADLRFTRRFQRRHADEARKQVQARMEAQNRFADEPGAREGLAAQLAARAKHNAYGRLNRISAPTLVLSGRYDGQAPLAAQRRMARRIAGAQHVVTPGGHNFIFEDRRGLDILCRFFMEV